MKQESMQTHLKRRLQTQKKCWIFWQKERSDWGDCLYLEPVLHHGERKEHHIEIEILGDKAEKATPFYLISLILA